MASFRFCLVILLLGLTSFARVPATDGDNSAETREPWSAATLSGLKFRSLGPAFTSGRVVGFAVDPLDRSHYYVAAGSGGVWKTTNGGTTWKPVFDQEGSYSIGCVVMDPNDNQVVWVGTGENNSQRSVGYGDGVYRSADGGRSWKNMGLKRSEHIGKILIDPRDSNTIYVAAQGPLWGPGGDRGLYKSNDGGATWNKVLEISENTGVTDVVFDARNPDVLIAAAYQRRRHVWTLINGGPESALYKSKDGGATWNKLKTGLPGEHLGRIGLATAPSDPAVVYAIIESIDKKGGIFRSTDFGETWEKRNEFDRQAQYYSHLVVDPANKDRIYVMYVRIHVSDDGGKTLTEWTDRHKHVDNHCLWVDPKDPKFYLVGCDGGAYESWDRGATWRFHQNLPITQFYDICVDQSGGPFYHVYGGTQDNFTVGGPIRTRTAQGILNSDWFVLKGGDGFQCKVDPRDSNIVYCESQYGHLARFDRRTGQRIAIQPQPGKGEPHLRWNWDAPLLLSPHAPTRLYFAANKLFRSDDRGDTWKAVSGDLTRQMDRNQLPVMGKVWGPDAVAKHLSTSLYGNCTALAESPKQEHLLYVGTDDGLIQVTEDAGANWRKIDSFPDVPEHSYVARLLASQHEADTVYAAFNNHKRADFKPYLLRSTDRGRNWTSIANGLPENGPVLSLAEDHVKPGLLFAGTEHHLYFTVDGGKNWTRLKGGLPTIAIKDLAIHKQQNDLVVGTFGRGIYVLDNYAVLRDLKPDVLKRESALLAADDGLLFMPSKPLGLAGKAWQGDGFYSAKNPPHGAVFTYYLKDGLKTRKQLRREAERRDGDTAYPGVKDLRLEDEEEAPALLLHVRDASGRQIRTLKGPASKGMHRVSWNLRDAGIGAGRQRRRAASEDEDPNVDVGGVLVATGTYQVQLAQRVDGVATLIGEPREFQVRLDLGINPDDYKQLIEFQQELKALLGAARATVQVAEEVQQRLEEIQAALDGAPAADRKWHERARELLRLNREILRELRGDTTMRRRNENTNIATMERVESVVGGLSDWMAKPTSTQRESYRIASEELGGLTARLRTLAEVDLKELEKALDQAGAPWTPGRIPDWKAK